MRRPLVALGSIMALLAPVPGSAHGPEVPDGFTDELVTTVAAPTALTFTPDGRMLLATQSGRLYLHDPDSTAALGPPVLDLSAVTCSNLERGLLGVAVDPDHDANRFIYAFYTVERGNECVHRVSRFELDDGTVDPSTETVLIDGIPSVNANHNGGDVGFGPDGFLYVSTGDGGCDYDTSGCAGANDASRDEHVLVGKLLRITRDGDAPPDNPFVGRDAGRCAATGRTTEGRRCEETFAWGLRNPFRFAIDPGSEGLRLFINDVGQDDWEEINAGAAGADYGWNVREGPCPRAEREDCDPAPDRFTEPIYAYPHDDCGGITGGAFVPEGAWPEEFDGAYLFSDYNCGTVFVLEEDGEGGFDRRPFISGLGTGSVVHMRFGPHGDGQALYYTTFEGGGQIRRLVHTGDANRAPTAGLTADRASGDTPLTVSFDASDSRDPDGDELRYRFNFGDDSAPVETDEPTIEHTYTEEGVHRATLVVEDDEGLASPAVHLRVGAGRHAPEVVIEAPGQPFAVGDELRLTARATDAEDGRLAGDTLSWTVLLHHDEHTHPFLGPAEGDTLRFVAPGPESLAAAPTSYLEVRLTATDSDGLTVTTVTDLRPRMVDVTLASDPDGFLLVVNGTNVQAPRTMASWVGYALDLEARNQDGYEFRSWSDGGEARHTVLTPDHDTTYTARFQHDAN